MFLTVADIEISCQFYQSALNFEVITFGENRKALQFDSQKINLHQVGKEFEPKVSVQPQVLVDLCFIAETPLKDVIAHLHALNIEIPAPYRKNWSNRKNFINLFT